VNVRTRRWSLGAAAAVLVLAAVLAIPAVRTRVLRAGGSALVAEDPISTANVIVITLDADAAGVLEAADLARQGVAPRVAVFDDTPDAVDAEFMRRGVPYEDGAARAIRQLRALGVQNVERIPRTVAGSEDESRVLPAWCDRMGFDSVVVVTRLDHSQRMRRLLRRAMSGRRVRVAIRGSRYSHFRPESWWRTRAGLRTGIIEMQKLLLDVARHPLS
jgi:hypothetical protein